jgi:peptidoglycan/LPS O-acetylase OafA/YrhL
MVSAYVSTAARVDGLAAGALIALLARGSPGNVLNTFQKKWLRGVGLAAALALIFTFFMRDGLSDQDPVVIMAMTTLLNVLFAALLAEALRPSRASWLARLLEAAPLRFFGRYSYGLYLVHQPICLFLWASGFMHALRSTVFSFVLPAAVSLVLAAASWHGIESRFLRSR